MGLCLVFFFLVLLTGNIRTHIRDQTGFEIMSSLQECINCIDTCSSSTFPHWQRLSSNSSCMTSRCVSVGRAGDPWRCGDPHALCGCPCKGSHPLHGRRAGRQTCQTHVLASREGTLLHLLSMTSSNLLQRVLQESLHHLAFCGLFH